MAKSRFKYNAVGAASAPSLGKKSFHSPVRPGRGHTERVPSGAGNVSSVNGKIARPGSGHTERVPRPGGTAPRAARPGWREKV